MKPLKPWLSLTDQLQLLQERGMRVDNPEAALNYLNRLGYYRLSGYWYSMRRIDQAASAEQNRAVRENSFIEVLDFGALSKLFSGMTYADQQAIASIYGAPTGKAFAQWLRSFNFIRNVSAHHSRLWNINVLEPSPVPKDWSPELKNSRPFLYFCLIQKLMRVICPNSSWEARFKTLLNEEFPTTDSRLLSLKDMGVIKSWEDWEVWRIE